MTQRTDSREKALAIADRLFPTDYIYDSRRSERAGYPVLYSTLPGCDAWISDLGCRLEINYADGTTDMIIIEEIPPQDPQPKKKTGRKTRRDVFASYGIEYKAGHIWHPVLGWLPLVLINGNSKLGKGVWTFSSLAGCKPVTFTMNGKEYVLRGSCLCHCSGCYAMTGNYRFSSVKASLGWRTWLVWFDVDFLVRAICAQIEAQKIRIVRIHASGDFPTVDYIDGWHRIIERFPDVVFWTYTKNSKAEHAFDDLNNVNVVPSFISGFGYNFGKAGYILKVYKALKAAGHSVYICRCGIDKNQHCADCGACRYCEYVLFIEHGTGYNPETDPDFPELKAIIEAQPRIELFREA